MSLVNVKSKLHRARLAFKAKFEPYLALIGPVGENAGSGSTGAAAISKPGGGARPQAEAGPPHGRGDVS